jgi:hypothetical protein
VNYLVCINMLQNILEKFEYFPIMCRVQRSLEIFRKNWELRKASDQLEYQGNQKVQSISSYLNFGQNDVLFC